MPAALRVLVVALGAALFRAPLVAQTGTVDHVTIDNVTIVDVVKGKLSPNMTVVVDGKRIVTVAKTRPGELHSGTVMDGAGMFVIPGLWDMHVHVAFTNDAARIQSTSALMLPLLIANGVTGVRDMGSNLDAILATRDAVASHQVIGPRIVTSGPMLDGPTSRYQVIVKVTTAEDGRAAIEDSVIAGKKPSKAAILAARSEADEKAIIALLHSELAWLVRAGFTPLEALQTATINPATYLGRTKDFGTVEAGKIADFVVLARNPLVSIGNTRSVVAVVADGRFYSAPELNKLRLHLLELAAK